MRPALLLAVLLPCALGARGARAVDPAVPLARLTLARWDESDGLPQPRVRAIAQDDDGYLWLGTDGGLVRFDGARFDVFTPERTGRALGTRLVRALLAEGGRLWIGTHGEGALARHDARGFQSLRGLADARGSAIVAMHLGRDGVAWFGSWSGVMRLRDTAWSSLGPEHGLPGAPVFAFADGDAGQTWVGTWAGLYRVRDDRAERVALAGVRADVRIRALARQDDTLWVGTFGEGLLRVHLGGADPGAQVRRYDASAGLPHPAIEALLVDRAGALWIGTRGGLARLRGDRLESAHREHPALGSPVESLWEDQEGRVWIGSASEGLLALSSGPVQAITEADGLPRQAVTAAALAGDGTIWVGTHGDGLARVRDGTTTRLTAADGLCVMTVAALLVEDATGALWIGGTGGELGNLCRYQDGRFTTFGPRDGLRASDAVRALFLDGSGALWVGGAGLSLRAGDRFVAQALPDESEHPWLVFGIYPARDGGLLVATSRGLFQGRPGRWRRITSWFVTAAAELDDGALWLGTLTGLVRRRPGQTWQQGREFGVPEQPVHGILDDGLGHLWVAAPTGLVRLTPAGADVAVRRFDRGDGLPTTQLTEAEGPSAAVRARDGRLLFATAKGLAIVDPERVSPAPPAPAARVEGLRVRHREIGLATPLRLRPGDGDLEIHYTAPAPARARRLRFRYRLEPFDADWVEAGARRVAIYTALPVGQYRFVVQALDEQGTAGPASPPLTLELPPAWYERRAVRLAGLLALVAAGLVLHRLRLARVAERHRAVAAERTRIARELHDSLTQKLTGISLHLEAAHRRLTSAPARAQSNLDQARALVRVGLSEARTAIWDQPPEELRDAGLPGALAALVRQMSVDVPIRLQVDGDGDGDGNAALTPEAAAALLRVAQEGLANALRHGSPTRVSLTLSHGRDAVVLLVADDGVGFTPTDIPADRGLSGLQARLRAQGGTLTWTSAPGRGTELCARIPRRRGDAAA